MNIETYIFGQFPSGYHQSPEDYTQPIFQALAQHSTAVTQLATYRKGNLMYYGYIRRLEGGHYIGLCAVLNGWYVKHPTELFAGFERIIERLVNDKTLIDYREGQVRALLTTSLVLGKQSALVRKMLTSIFESQEIAPLPAVSYGTSDDAVKRYNTDSNLEAIEASVYTQAYTIIAKHEGYDTFLKAYKKDSNPKTAVNTKEADTWTWLDKAFVWFYLALLGLSVLSYLYIYYSTVVDSAAYAY